MTFISGPLLVSSWHRARLKCVLSIVVVMIIQSWKYSSINPMILLYTTMSPALLTGTNPRCSPHIAIIQHISRLTGGKTYLDFGQRPPTMERHRHTRYMYRMTHMTDTKILGWFDLDKSKADIITSYIFTYILCCSSRFSGRVQYI